MSTVTIPAGYDPTPLSPKIEILDENDVVQYTYESDAIHASGNGTQDFALEEWNIHRGVNTDHGSCVLTIDDENKDLLDLTDARRESKINGTWKVRVSLGKNSTNVNEWFRGFILGNDPEFPNPIETKHRIFVTGEGVKTAYYKTLIRFFQKKLSDGETLDTTDLDAKVSELFKRLVTDTDHYPIPVDALGFSTTDVQDIDIKIPDYQKNFESIGQCLNELASVASAYYGIDIGAAYLRRRDSVDSQFLITNMDYSDIIKDNWDQDKTCYLMNSTRGWKNDFTDFGIAFFNGLNTQKPIKDQEQTSANASLDLSSKHFAFPITPDKDNILKIAPFLAKIGTVTDDLTIKILGDDGTGKPNSTDKRISKVIRGAQLQSELTVSKYFEVLFNKYPIVPGTKLFCTFEQYVDTVNYPTLDYQTLTGEYFDSTNGTSWTSRVGDVKFRQYAAKTINVYCENTVASRKFPGIQRQMNVPLSNLKSNAMALVTLAGVAVSRGKQRRQYPSFAVSPPTTPLGLGKTLRYIDIRTGLEFSPNLIAYDIGGSAFNVESNLGAKEISLTVEEWGY